jgi:sugar/nucleoside kinase (ribokinase family)
MPVLIVGSIALDTVKTPAEEHADLLGGSASYAAVSASFFTGVQLVGIVGSDFPAAHIDYFRQRGIDLEGLQQVEGASFRWSGEYMTDMNVRETRSVALNVFEHFSPHLPESYRQTPYVLLANIAPSLQSYVPDLIALLGRVDLLILNDGEAKMLTDESNLIRAAAKIRALGPRYVAIKKGEHGCLLFGDPEAGEFFSCPAFPLADLLDPTGAGDCFAGALIGALALADETTVTFGALRRAVVAGSVVASYNVEAFSLERLRRLTEEEIKARHGEFGRISRF